MLIHSNVADKDHNEEDSSAQTECTTQTDHKQVESSSTRTETSCNVGSASIKEETTLRKDPEALFSVATIIRRSESLMELVLRIESKSIQQNHLRGSQKVHADEFITPRKNPQEKVCPSETTETGKQFRWHTR